MQLYYGTLANCVDLFLLCSANSDIILVDDYTSQLLLGSSAAVAPVVDPV